MKWYGISELSAREPFNYDRIVYAIHFYEPFVFTHQGAAWTGMGTTRDIPDSYSEASWSSFYRDFGFSETTNEPWQLEALKWYHTEGNSTAMYNRIAKAKEWAITHQVPLVCNEFGAHTATSRADDRVRYYEDLINIFTEQAVAWQIWFMVMDPDTGAIDPALTQALELNSPG